MQKLKELLIACFIVLIPFQDSALQLLPIGTLGTCPAFIPLVLLILISLIEWLVSSKAWRVNKTLFCIIGYALFMSLLYLLLTGVESHGRNLIFKTFSLSILTLLFLYPAFFINYKEVPKLGRYVRWAFIVAVIGVILNDIVALDFVVDTGLIHAHPNENLRPRGLSSEASYLSATIMSLGLLSAHFTKSKFFKLLIITIAVAIAIFCASKGGLVTLFLIALVMVPFKSGMKSWVRLSIIAAIILVFILQFDQFLASLLGDMESTTSTATRTVMLTTSMITVYHNPLGVGFSGFLPAIDEYMMVAIDFIGNFFSVPLKFIEVFSYIDADTDRSISTKTFLFDNLAYFGLPFVLLYIRFHKRLIGRLFKTNHNFLTAGVLFCLIVISTYIPGLGIYSISLLYGVAFNELYSE